MTGIYCGTDVSNKSVPLDRIQTAAKYPGNLREIRQRNLGSVMVDQTSNISAAKALISNAHGILIFGGAGMSADSGLPTFRDANGFWKQYPHLGQKKIHFESIANPEAFRLNPRLAWGFYGHRMQLYKNARLHSGYRNLASIAKKTRKGAFYVTTNVDGHFQKSEICSDNIWEMHGSIFSIQCSEPCSSFEWAIDPDILDIDKNTGLVSGEVPKCHRCGALARPNILMFYDSEWVSERYDEQERHFRRFVAETKKCVVIEIGAGTNLPSLRYLSASLNYPVIRINPDACAVSGVRDVALPMTAENALELLVGNP